MSLKQQAQVYMDSHIVIFTHGAACGNVIFMSPVCCPKLLTSLAFECTPWLLVCVRRVLAAGLLQCIELIWTMHVMTAGAWSLLFGGQMHTPLSCAYKPPKLILQDMSICCWLSALAQFAGNLTCTSQDWH